MKTKGSFSQQRNTMKTGLEISVILPFLDEEGSLRILYERLVGVLEKVSRSFEVVFIDDGSTDDSYRIAKEIEKNDSRVNVIKLRHNCGKARALKEGFESARGNIVFTMDADLQDDPEEIPNFLKKMSEGYDLVSGWKKKRHDPLEKRLPSKLFNKVTSLLTGLRLHDFNCGYKSYRREILDEIKVYGELHRYIPALAHRLGYRVGEIPVRHHPRQSGKSKYGLGRYLRGVFDLLTVILLIKFIRSPMYLFALTGFVSIMVGACIIAFLTSLQILFGGILGHRPLSFLGVLLILLGGQLFSLGLIGEYIINIFQRRRSPQVSIRKVINLGKRSNPNKLISVVIPIHNEAGNLEILYKKLVENLRRTENPYEIIFVDDGSEDQSPSLLELLAERDSSVRVIQLRKRFGKASALRSGFEHAKGKIIVTLNGDLQDDPDNLQRFLIGIEEGYDFVSGRRTNVPFPRVLFSRVFNLFVSIITGIRIRDVNCGFKTFRREVLDDLPLYGGLQRFLPVFASKNGYRVKEIEVEHHERHSGLPKYNWTRIPKGFIDLVTVVLLTGYRRRPLHLFGSIGLLITSTGGIICLALTLLKILTGTIQGHNTLLLMGVMLIVFGFQWLSLGLLCEIITNLDQQTGRRKARS